MALENCSFQRGGGPESDRIMGGDLWPTVDGSEILRSPVEVGSSSHYLQAFIHPRWLALGFQPSTVCFPSTTWHEKNKSLALEHQHHWSISAFTHKDNCNILRTRDDSPCRKANPHDNHVIITDLSTVSLTRIFPTWGWKQTNKTKQDKTNTSTHAINLKSTINSTPPNLIRGLRRNFQWPYPALMPGLPPSSCSKKFPSFHPFLVVPPFWGKHIGSGGEKALGLGNPEASFRWDFSVDTLSDTWKIWRWISR